MRRGHLSRGKTCPVWEGSASAFVEEELLDSLFIKTFLDAPLWRGSWHWRGPEKEGPALHVFRPTLGGGGRPRREGWEAGPGWLPRQPEAGMRCFSEMEGLACQALLETSRTFHILKNKTK